MSSVAGFADPVDKVHKKSFHRRHDSGELDVFEAARYFSGYNEVPTATSMVKEERSSWRGARISLDMPIRHVLNHHQQQQQQLPHLHHHQHHHHAVDQNQKQQNLKDQKIKYKQPSSPGGRLASFLNSLFNQSGSKKKKSKSSSTQSMKDEEESPGGRRRRRSSISHFRSSSAITSTADAKSIYSSSSSGFRTPPPYNAQVTSAKSYRELRSYSDHKNQQSLSNLSKYSDFSHSKSTASDEKGSSNRSELSWLDEKFKHKSEMSVPEKYKISSDPNKGLFKRLSEVVDDDEDDGADSDSSSDLFELQNYDLGCYSSGLPVYETTSVDSIKNIRGTPIANAS